MDNEDETDKKDDRRPKIRPISRDTVSMYSKLKSCRCFPEIDRRLRLGWSTADLVKVIREEQDECTDLSEKYVAKMIDSYRASIPPAELSMTSANSLVARNATKKVAEGINELAELEKLYKIQLDRIEMGVSNEQKIGMLMQQSGKEVFVAMKILKQSADLKMDLGLVKRQLGTMEVTGQLAAEATERYGNESIGRVIADPDSRRKVLNLAHRLMSIGAEASIDAVALLGAASDAEPAPVEAKRLIDIEEPPPADTMDPE